jgi:hypothetical protein
MSNVTNCDRVLRCVVLGYREGKLCQVLALNMKQLSGEEVCQQYAAIQLELCYSFSS